MLLFQIRESLIAQTVVWFIRLSLYIAANMSLFYIHKITKKGMREILNTVVHG